MNYHEKSKILSSNLVEMHEFKSRSMPPVVDWGEDMHDPIEKKMATKDFPTKNVGRGHHRQFRGQYKNMGSWPTAGNFHPNWRNQNPSTAFNVDVRDRQNWRNQNPSTAFNVDVRDNYWRNQNPSTASNVDVRDQNPSSASNVDARGHNYWHNQNPSSASNVNVNDPNYWHNQNPSSASNVNVNDPNYWHNQNSSSASNVDVRVHNYQLDKSGYNPPSTTSSGCFNTQASDQNFLSLSVAPSDSVSVVKCESEAMSSVSTSVTIVDISPMELAQNLSKYNNFKCSLIDLIDDCNFNHKKVKEIANQFDDTFEMLGADISLKPKIKICLGHLSQEGCPLKADCRDLHICPNFITDDCGDDECLNGHFWKTNHNKKILEKHFIANFQLPALKNLLQSLLQAKDVKDNKGGELKVCLKYNANNCSNDQCDCLHICLNYLSLTCSNNECSLNHSIREKRTSALLLSFGISSNESPKEVLAMIKSCPLIKAEITVIDNNAIADPIIPPEDMNSTKSEEPIREKVSDEVKTTVWANDLLGEVLVEEICYYSVHNYCNYEEAGCWRLHSKEHFHWQIEDQNKPWINLPEDQVFALERNYCDPNINEFELPILDPSNISPSSKGLLTSMRGRSIWKTDFDKMILTTGDSKAGTTFKLRLRRLCSQYLPNIEMPEASVFVWYFTDIKDNWIEYGKTDSTEKDDVKCSINSEDIENHRRARPNSPLAFQSQKYTYVLDTVMLEQTNLSTSVSRLVRRRPKFHLKDQLEKSIAAEITNNFPPNWDPMKPEVKQIRVSLSNNSKEFKDICDYMKQKGGNFTILKIERIQNQFLYYAFKNKIQNLNTIYTNTNDLNIQQLFHGTVLSNVDAICDQNFDWRLHGSSAGQAYGRGTYFATCANTSYGYAKADSSNHRHMFIAQVIVGSVVLGNSSMVRPPHNPITNALFDSSCDNVSAPGIIVKYDNQEYYPEYILTIQ